ITVLPNTQPTFDVYTCDGREVQVRVTDTNYDSYKINYDYQVPDDSVPKGSLAVDNYTYPTAGVDTIAVRGKNNNSADNCTPAI
ncbi:hypothetical protein, partial [Enterococcus casseliflavus]|uniref:hypothetical protein n=1 Tax=Enterococcus casseliflavus TaxID=37734 RepID=UPI003D0ED0ED